MAGGSSIGVMSRGVESLFQKIGHGAERYTRRIVKLRPRILPTENQVCQKNPRDRSMCDSVSGISGDDENVLISAGIFSNERHVINGLHDLARPAEIHFANHWKALAGPLLEG